MEKKTQRQLSKETGIALAHLNRILVRKTQPKVGKAILIARALDVDVEEYFGGWADEARNKG